MAGLLHFGIGLAYKRIRPEYHVLFLVFLSYLLDVVFGVFWVLGLEHLPEEGGGVNPWSHGVFMGIVWSSMVAVLFYWKTNNRNTSLSLGLLVLSHLIIDVIVSPMIAVYSGDTPLPVFFTDKYTVGLGLWSTDLAVILGEYVLTTFLGIIYLVGLFSTQDYSKQPKEVVV